MVLKIAHIATIDWTVRQMLLNKLVGLKNLGYEVHAISSPGKYVDEISQAGICFHPLKMDRNINLINDFNSIIHMTKLLSEEKFHIVHTHTAKAGFIGRVAAKIVGVPIIIHTAHGLPFYSGQSLFKFNSYRILEKIAGCFSDLIFSQNQEDINNLIDYKIIQPNKAKFEGNGINLDILENKRCLIDRAAKKRELKLTGEEKIIGFFARFEPVKGHKIFFQALKKVVEKYPETVCLVAGKGYLEDELKSLVHKLSIYDNVKFLGYREDIIDLIEIIDLLILPSQKEGIPRVVMETMFASKPVVATDVLGTRELVKDGLTGYLVPYGDVNALEKAIVKLFSDKKIMKEFGYNGRQSIIEKFNEKDVIRRIDEQYRRLSKEKLRL